MTEAEWLACDDPDALLDSRVREWSQRQLRLFAVACCDRNRDHICDEVSRNCVEMARALADGNATMSERRAAVVRAMADENASVTAACVGAVDAYEAAIRTSFHAAVELARHRFPHLYESGERTPEWNRITSDEWSAQTLLLRDIFGNPFRPVAFDHAWRTDTAVAVACTMYDSREFGAMPILADALQDAGCEDEQVLNHCRAANQVHVRGCWVCDLVLGNN